MLYQNSKFVVMLVLFGFILGAMPVEAQTDGNESYEQVMHRYSQKLDELNGQTLDKVEDIKSLIGQIVCLRPREVSIYETVRIAPDDLLEVVKAKKDLLTVKRVRDEQTIKIPQRIFHKMMTKAVIDEIEQTRIEMDSKTAEALDRQRKANEERAAREKAESEAQKKQAALKKYHAEVEAYYQLQQQTGPINTKMERAYKGEIPYWRWIGENSGKIETIRDEKFVLSPVRFTKATERIRKKLYESEKEQFEQLLTMQADTFGIYNWNTFINLRTGDTFCTDKKREMSTKWWESVTYLARQQDEESFVYDGTMSLSYLLKHTGDEQIDGVLERLVGERVFFLDSMKYDVITGFHEQLRNWPKLTMYLEKRGKDEYWDNHCISVKWYEQMQKMVGKKAIKGDDIYLTDAYRPTWKEDIPNKETFLVDSIGIKNHKMFVILLTEDGEKKEVEASGDINDKFGLLAYPIDYALEKELRLAGVDHLKLDHKYVSYDAALATMPAKTAEAKQKEAKNAAEWDASSKRLKALQQHKLVGTSLATFLRTYRGARLVHTTSEGGITIKVYQYTNYQLVFHNDQCVSITNL